MAMITRMRSAQPSDNFDQRVVRCFRRLRICFGVEPQHHIDHQPQHHQGDSGHEDQEKIVEIRNLRHVVGRRILKPQLPGLGLGGQRVSGKKPKTEKAETELGQALPKNSFVFSRELVP